MSLGAHAAALPAVSPDTISLEEAASALRCASSRCASVMLA